MGDLKKIDLIRDDKIIGNIMLLCLIYLDEYDSNYIVYSKNDDNLPSDFNIVYYGKVIKKDGVDYLVSISESDELNYVKNRLKKLFNYCVDIEGQKKSNFDRTKIPDNLFGVNYGDDSVINRESVHATKYDEISFESSLNSKEYKNRLKEIFDNLNDIKPVRDIPDVLYVNYYNEMGMILKSKIITLKQMWTEYQLQFNSLDKDMDTAINNIDIDLLDLKDDDDVSYDNKEILEDDIIGSDDISIDDDFDSLFDSLSKRIESIDEYLRELRELKNDIKLHPIDVNNDDAMSYERKRLEQEKKEFEEYKKIEKAKLSNRKDELQLHFNKFQTIVENFDKKIKDK